MSPSLWNHQRRLHDLEVAVETLHAVINADPAKAPVLRDAAQRLRARGDVGAAELLNGAPAAAAYRR